MALLPSKLNPTQQKRADRLIAAVERMDVFAIDKLLPHLEELALDPDTEPKVKLNIFNALTKRTGMYQRAMIEMGLESSKGKQSLTQNNVYNFNFSPDEYKALPEPTRIALESLRLRLERGEKPNVEELPRIEAVAS